MAKEKEAPQKETEETTEKTTENLMFFPREGVSRNVPVSQ